MVPFDAGFEKFASITISTEHLGVSPREQILLLSKMAYNRL